MRIVFTPRCLSYYLVVPSRLSYGTFLLMEIEPHHRQPYVDALAKALRVRPT